MISIEEGVKYLETEFGMVMEKSGMGEGLYDCKMPVWCRDELLIRANIKDWEVLTEEALKDWIDDEEAYFFILDYPQLREIINRLEKEILSEKHQLKLIRQPMNEKETWGVYIIKNKDFSIAKVNWEEYDELFPQDYVFLDDVQARKLAWSLYELIEEELFGEHSSIKGEL